MLDEDFSNPYIDDIPAVPVWRGDDYLLFYGCGVINWTYDKSTESFVHTNNPYSNYGYYFLTDATGTKEMESVASAAGASLKVTTFDDYRLHEKDLVSVNNSGRELFGEAMDMTLSRDFSFTGITGITNDDGKIALRFIAKPTTGNGSVSMSVDGEKLLEKTIAQSGSSGSETYTMARLVYEVVDWKGDKGTNVKVNVRYGQLGHKNVHLDYIRLQMKRELQPYGVCTFFRSLASVGNASRFVIQNANTNTMVFDVTDKLNPKQMETELSGNELSFSIPAGTLREFALVQRNQAFPSPEVVGDVTNQDLHALPQTDMIIIAQPGLTAQAERLAEAHRTRDGLTVQVVTPDAIYNEFSSGTPDATAYRRFMKMFYDRQTSEEDAPKYLLLFGDGAFDNRFITSGWQNVTTSNMLLTYQTEESLNERSFVIDDYFGFLDDSNNGKELMSARVDIGIGRFPVRTLAEATNMVNKVIGYMDNKDTGSWKNNVCFVADDGSSADGYMINHADQADRLGEYINTSHPEFLVNKIYFDAYKKDVSGGLATYPDVKTNIQKQLKNGLLLINYTGHGSTTAWSDERVLTESDITQSTYTRLPIWITATCDFCRFDASVTSAGEQVFLNKVSGGIGLFTTTRVAYSTPNFEINDNLIRNLFEKKNGRRLTLGEVMKATKRALGSSRYKLGFALIGDPALKLAYPEYRMQVTAVNGNPVTDEPVDFKALQKITVEGEVLNADGNVATDFSGLLNPTVLDSRVSYETLDNNKTGNTFKYTDYSNILFIGNDSVRAGKFSFTFTVPKDISYSNEFGKMNLYASDETNNLEAQGAYLNYRVGGTDDNAEDDHDGPEIRVLYMNDSTFVNGGQVNMTPFFVARLWDKSGVNITGSSIGHDMMLIIDGDPSLSFNLNSYYELIPGKDGEGIVKYLLPALTPGIHTAEFKVWDIQNNSTTYEFEFEVVEGLKPYLLELTATPSPAREQVEFHLFHNRPESQLTVGIMVYDMMGRLQWKHQETGASELFKSYTVTWDLTNNRGGRLRPGIYIYRAAISSGGSKEATDAKKLIILAQ
jgi:Peptidase family C25.